MAKTNPDECRNSDLRPGAAKAQNTRRDPGREQRWRSRRRSADVLRQAYPYYLAGKPLSPNRDLVVSNKYTGQPAARVAAADSAAVDAAIAAAVRGFQQTRRLAGFERKRVLEHIVRRVDERAEEFARALAIEAGKPIRDARGEVTRLADTFRIAADEATRTPGEYLPLDISPRAAGYESLWRRFPAGPCAFITPFNFPLNLV